MPRKSLAELQDDLYRWADENRRRPTPEERILSEVLHEAVWEFQYPMILRGPRRAIWPVIFDAFAPNFTLAIELDGKHHRKGPDGRRDRVAAFNGIKTLRYPNRRIHKELKQVLEEIAAAIKERIA